MQTRLSPPSSATHSAVVAATHRPRCVLLAGSARGGTSWALKVLDSHPGVQACHEPFYRLSYNEQLQTVYDRIKAGQGTATDSELLTQALMKACMETHKPPFFRKHFLNSPALLRTTTWMMAKAFKPMRSTFNYLASAELNNEHCIVIKNRPFPKLDRILVNLQADALILLRHPCGVVSSWLRGIRIGVMHPASVDSETVWGRYANYLVPLGISEADLGRMSPAGILAINWLVDASLFQQYEQSSIIKTRVMVYEDLVRNSLEEWAKVFQWLHLPFDSAVESFLDRSSTPGFDVRRLLGEKFSYFSVQRGEKSPVESWRQELTSKEIKEVISIVTPHFSVEQYWPDAS